MTSNLQEVLQRIQELMPVVQRATAPSVTLPATGPATSGSTGFAGALDSAGSGSAATSSTASGATPYAAAIDAAGQRYGIDPLLIQSVIQQESGFNPNSTSSAGAQGLMQLMPSTSASMGVTNPYDPNQSIDGGARVLRQALDQFGGNTQLALAAYNAGSGAVTRYGGIPPYPETQNYVRNIMAHYQQLTDERTMN